MLLKVRGSVRKKRGGTHLYRSLTPLSPTKQRTTGGRVALQSPTCIYSKASSLLWLRYTHNVGSNISLLATLRKTRLPSCRRRRGGVGRGTLS